MRISCDGPWKGSSVNTKTEILIGFAEMCGERLTDTRMKAYLFALKDLSVDELKASVFKLMNDPSLTRFPMPGKILEHARPQISTEDDAKEAAARIIHAVSKFGWCNRQEARAYIGELGWQVVEMQGGWVNLCENMRPNMIPNLQAQFRELAKTVHTKSRLGTLDTPPALPGNVRNLFQIKGVDE